MILNCLASLMRHEPMRQWEQGQAYLDWRQNRATQKTEEKQNSSQKSKGRVKI